MDVAAAVDDDLRFAANEQHDRAVRLTNIERLVILIEDENVLRHNELK